MSIQRAYFCECRVSIAHDPQGEIRYCETHKAAPELLTALEKLLQCADEVTARSGWPDNSVRTEARAIIAKAKVKVLA